MKKLEYISLVFLLGLNFLTAQFVQSASIGLTTPFGGRVTATTMGNTYCYPGGTGPITINPAGKSATSPYYYQSYNTEGSRTAPTSGRYVLGNKMPLMIGSCYDQDGPYQIPHPAYRVTLYGVSKPNVSNFNFKTGK